MSWSLEPINGGELPPGASLTSSGDYSTNFTFTPANNGSFAVRLVATDADGLSDSVDLTIQAANVAPDAEITAITATRIEGEEIVVSATASDPGGANDPLVYEYAVFQNGDETPILTDQGEDLTEIRFTPADEGDYEIRLVVRDDDGGESPVVSQTITIDNADPVIDSFTLPETVTAGETATLTAMVSDAGVNDVLSATIDWGDGVVESTSITGGQINADHIYATEGNYSVTLTIDDGDGGQVTATGSLTVESGVNQFVINGTDGNDQIFVLRWFNRLKVYSSFGGWSSYDINEFDEVVINAGGGNDYIQGSIFLTTPLIVDGGSGSDWFFALLADDGKDKLQGLKSSEIVEELFHDSQPPAN